LIDLPPLTTVETQRLRLEPFDLAHAPALNAINNEPAVMRFLSDGDPETLADTQAAMTRSRTRWRDLGYSWWAVIERASDRIIGAACLQHIANVPEAELEIGWRLGTAHTGHGYATEAGLAAARFAFDVIGADYVVASAHQDNIASHKVMQRIGMQYRGLEPHYDNICTTYILHKADCN